MKTLHSLEGKRLIKIADDADLNSSSLPGTPLSLKAFKIWIKDAEEATTSSLKQAKTKWVHQRKQL
ncbi:MAG TPA: hypothetical protein VF476_18815 [Chitinophagaceae bacterium]